MAAPARCEALEGRQMLSVSTDAGGWTNVTPGAGAKVVYVSAARGNDANAGVSPSSPVKTLRRATSLVRNGAGDQILLNRGETWHESFGTFDKSGRSTSEPTVIGAYGTGARPTVVTGSSTAISFGNKGISHLAILGVHLDGSSHGRSLPDGVSSTGKTSDVLIEDCEIEGYRNNLVFQNFLGPVSNIRVRRSVIADAYSFGSHSQGIYADGVQGIRLEDSVFDHNGWGHGAGQTMFNHGAYITAKSSGLVATGNIFSNSSSHGLQARPGGTVQNNLFYNNAIGLSYGLVNGGGVLTPGGVSGTVANNVFIGGHSISGLPAGVGAQLGNVFASGDTSSRNAAIELTEGRGVANASQGVGIKSLTVADNVVYKWSQALQVNANIKGLTVKDNDFQNITAFQAVVHVGSIGSAEKWSGNRYNIPGNARTPVIVGGKALTVGAFARTDAGAKDVRVGYPDAGRGSTSYAAGVVAKARNMSRQNWSPANLGAAIAAYVKAGFGNGNAVPSVPVVGTGG